MLKNQKMTLQNPGSNCDENAHFGSCFCGGQLSNLTEKEPKPEDEAKHDEE